jgi:hypothetical protein
MRASLFIQTTFEQVALFYEDGQPVNAKGIGGRILERVQGTSDTELAGKQFTYDGAISTGTRPCRRQFTSLKLLII